MIEGDYDFELKQSEMKADALKAERDALQAKLDRVVEVTPTPADIDDWGVSDWRGALIAIHAIVEGEG